MESDGGQRFDLCSECHDMYATSLSHMDIAEVVEQQRTDKDLQHSIAEGKQNRKDLSKRSFFPETVQQSERFSMKVKRKAIMVGHSEFHRIFNQKPTKRVTRFIPQMQLHSEGDLESETVYLFACSPNHPTSGPFP